MMQSRAVRVEGQPDLVRDRLTKAVVNINMDEYERAIAAKRSRKARENEFQHLKDQVSDLTMMIRNLMEAR